METYFLDLKKEAKRASDLSQIVGGWQKTDSESSSPGEPWPYGSIGKKDILPKWWISPLAATASFFNNHINL